MALTDKLKHADKLKAELNALLPMSADNEKRWWEKVRLDWNYNSNHIEGNTLTYGETKLLLIFDKTTGDHDLREYEEMTAHDIAIKLVKEWAMDKGRDLTERDIRELNKIILVKNYWKDAITPDGQPTKKEIKVGEYKETPNSVKLKSGGEFEFASPLETPQKMAELIQWYRNENKLHPLVLASKFHYDFIRIHPFDDGNGRVARLIVNYVLMKDNFPPLIIKSEERDKYITALNKADVGDKDAFHEYMADQLIHALELAIKAAKGESIEEPDDAEKEVIQWKQKLKNSNPEIILKSNTVVYETYKNGIKQLLQLFQEKMKVFDDMFSSKEYLGIVNDGGTKLGLAYIDSTFYKWKNKQLNINEFKNTYFKIEYKNFNRHLPLIDESCDISVDFLNTSYTIKVNGAIFKELLYSKIIDEDMARNIVSECIKATKNKIDAKINN